MGVGRTRKGRQTVEELQVAKALFATVCAVAAILTRRTHMSYNSVMAGTEVQEVRERLNKAKDEYLQRVSEITGAEAGGRSFEVEPFSELQPAIATLEMVNDGIIQWKIERIVKEAEERGEA